MVIKQIISHQPTKYNERVYWNNQTYGKAISVNKRIVLSLITVVCLITPFTNWLIPIAIKGIKKDLVIRYD